MNKTERLSFIKSRYAEKFGVQLASGLLPVSRAEIKDEARTVKSRVAREMDDSLATGDEVEIGSQLVFDKAEIKAERETDILLSAEEKRELAKVILAKKKVFFESADVSEDSDRVELTAADLPVPVFTREESEEVSTFARLWAEFELAAVESANRLYLTA